MPSPSNLTSSYGVVMRGKPQVTQEQDERELRLSRYGDITTQGMWQTTHPLADEGSYFVATNPTMGTAVATTTSITAFTAASPVLAIQNGATTGDPNAPRLYIDYMRLIQSQVPTSASTWHWAIVIDGVGSNRYTSGGSVITPVNTNMDSSAISVAKVYFGAIVAAAASSQARIIHRSVGRSVIPVINDETIFNFGSIEFAGSLSLGGTIAERLTIPSGPAVLGPGQWLLLYGWAAANAAAPSWEFELGWAER